MLQIISAFFTYSLNKSPFSQMHFPLRQYWRPYGLSDETAKHQFKFNHEKLVPEESLSNSKFIYRADHWRKTWQKEMRDVASMPDDLISQCQAECRREAARGAQTRCRLRARAPSQSITRPRVPQRLSLAWPGSHRGWHCGALEIPILNVPPTMKIDCHAAMRWHSREPHWGLRCVSLSKSIIPWAPAMSDDITYASLHRGKHAIMSSFQKEEQRPHGATRILMWWSTKGAIQWSKYFQAEALEQ